MSTTTATLQTGEDYSNDDALYIDIIIISNVSEEKNIHNKTDQSKTKLETYVRENGLKRPSV